MWRSVLLVICLIELSQQEDFVPIVTQNFEERLNSELQQQIASYVTQEVTYKAYASYYERADVALPGFKQYFTSLAKTAAKNARSLTDLVNKRGGRVRFPVIQVKDACEVIRKHLSLGEITKVLDPQSVTDTARQDPLICYFQLINNPLLTHKKKQSSSYFSWIKSKFGKKAKKKTMAPRDAKTDSENQARTKMNRESWHDGLYGLEDALAMEKVTNSDINHMIKIAKTFTDPQIRHQLKQYLSTQTDNIYHVAKLVQRLQPHQRLDSYHLEQYLLDEELQS